jgi:capsular exopolysaccharide synthesis family protein
MKNPHNSRGTNNNTSDRTIQEYLAVIVREKKLIITVFLTVLIGTAIITKLTKPTYRAATQVILSKSEARSSVLFDAMRADRMENIVQNELAILGSRTLCDTVASRLIQLRMVNPSLAESLPMLRASQEEGGNDSLASLAEISGRVSGAVDFEPVRESDLIVVTAVSRDPREAALIANTFAESYRDRNVWMSRTKTRTFREFLESQAREKQRQLEQIEGSLQTYMQKEGIVSLDDESKKVIDQLAQLEANRDATDISLRQMQNQLASYQEQLPQQETNVARAIGEATDPYIRQLQEQIARLEVQKDVTVAQNPQSVGREIVTERVKEIDSQITALRQKLQRRTDEFLQSLTPTGGASGSTDAAGYLRTVKQKIIETQIDVLSLQAKKKALEEQIKTYEGQFNRIPKKSTELARLQRARLSNEKLYLMVEEKYNEANINEKSNQGYIDIIEPAAPPLRPSSPKVLVNLALGVLFGLVFGLAVAFVKEYFDVRVQTPEDLKRHGYNPLTTIANIDAEVQRLGGQRVGPGTVDKQMISLSFPFSSIAESFRQVRTQMQFSRQGEAFKTLLISSPTPGDGKTTVVANLAVTFAQSGKKTLLVNTDLRRPSVESKFSVPMEPGLSDYLQGKATLPAATHSSGVEHLWIVPCGSLPSNPAEILGSQKMKDFLELAKKQYDVLLIDSSPVLSVTDASIVSTYVDGTLFVVSARRTRLEELQQATETVEAVGGKILGVIVNNFDVHLAYGISSRRARGGYSYANQYVSDVRKQGESQEAGS